MRKDTLEYATDPVAPEVAIVESRPMFRIGLAGVLTKNWENASVSEAVNLDEFGKRFTGSPPDVILLGFDSSEEKKIAQQIGNLTIKYPSAKVVIYDYQGNLQIIPQLLRLGIAGYLAADFDIAELRLCMETVLEGKKYINNELIWNYLNHETEVAAPAAARLSKMEEVVANYLTQGMSVSIIAKTMNRQISTISTVKAKVFKKLNVANVLDLKDVLQRDFGSPSVQAV